jgi:hypothetical protein
MEPDDDLWEHLVHPPQLNHISQASWDVINLPHSDIQGELWGKLGVQQQPATGDITRDMGRITVGGDSLRTKTEGG